MRSSTSISAPETFLRDAIKYDMRAYGAVTSWTGVTYIGASPRGICIVRLPLWNDATRKPQLRQSETHVEQAGDNSAEAYLCQGLRELGEYFDGTREQFAVPLDLRGPAFFQRVWHAVASVLYGETRTYADIARELGVPNATRAVGAANGSNPVAPFVPCHRIVGSNGGLTGYGPGLPLKRHLLAMERAIPVDAESVDVWRAEVARRLGTPELMIGVRPTRQYCRSGCGRWRKYLDVPPRLFASPSAAEAAGFTACAACRSEQPALFSA